MGFDMINYYFFLKKQQFVISHARGFYGLFLIIKHIEFSYFSNKKKFAPLKRNVFKEF